MVCKFVAQEPTCFVVEDGLSHKRVGGAIAPTGCGGLVEPLSPMAPEAAQAAASWVFDCWSRRLRWLEALIDWGQSIYHAAKAPRELRIPFWHAQLGTPWILLIQAGGRARISSYPQNLEMR